MARVIQEHIKKPLAEMVLFGSLSEGGGDVRISVEDDALVLEAEPELVK
jgi:ATP-dependent Clp protease ATP-binding subunit ClpA